MKISALFCLLALIISLNPDSALADDDFRHWLSIVNGEEHYQQPGYLLVDPKGDAYLIRKLHFVPWKLMDALFGKKDKDNVQLARSLGFDLNLPQEGDFACYDSDDQLLTERELIDKAYEEALENQYYDYGDIEEVDDEDLFRSGSLRLSGIDSERELNTRHKEEEKGFKIGKKRPIIMNALMNQIIKDIKESGIQPKLGLEHKWSPSAQKYNRFGFVERFGEYLKGDLKRMPTPLFWSSKLFLSLACGWTAKYEISGKEQALLDKLLEYPDNSVQLHDLFRESYILNDGDLYLTLLTAENVLGHDPYDPERDKQPAQIKLSYIRNDSKPLGDKYGSWYHFYGIALYGLVRKGLVSRAVGEIESCGSVFLEGIDWQEDHINRLGATFGNRLRKMMDKKLWQKPLETTDFAYMDMTEFAPKINSQVGHIIILDMEENPRDDKIQFGAQISHKKGIFSNPQNFTHIIKISDLPSDYSNYQFSCYETVFERGKGWVDTGKTTIKPEQAELVIRLSKAWLESKSITIRLNIKLEKKNN